MQNFRELMRWNRAQFLGLGIGAVIIAIAFIVFNSLTNDAAKAWDIKWGYWWFLALGIFSFVSLLINIPDIFKSFKQKIPPISSIIIVAVITTGLGLFIHLNISKQHRVLSDENSWESMGLQMLYHQSGGVCNQGIWEAGKLKCTDEVNNFKGKSLSFVYSIIFRIFPAHRDTALATSLPFYLASLILLFFAIYRFSNSHWIALSAITFLGTMPIMMLQSKSASTEVLYIFLLSAILFIYSLFPPNKVNWKQLLLAIGILGFLSGTRQESIFCFIPFVLYYHDFLRKKSWHFPLIVLLLILASWPAINTMAAYRGYDFQGGEFDAHSLANLWFNIKSNLAIMLNPGIDGQGLLKNPFYSIHTIILIFSSSWLVVRMITHRKYVWEALLFILFHIQSLVILVNVSGTFEIDINQRYVLIALPSFAWIMAMGLGDFFKTFPTKNNPIKKHAYALSFIIAIALGVFLSHKHQTDFQANILYKRNKLLTEENFLNAELAKLPENSLFLYSRPWQMLCSRFNSFNENSILNWTNQELAYWRQFTDNNIYLVRGQDGYGQVDRKSRVVGFKTTEPVERILEEFDHERILINSQDFGYPLTIYKIGIRKGSSHYSQNLALTATEYQVQDIENLEIHITKSLEDTLDFVFHINDKIIERGSLQAPKTTINLKGVKIPPGLHRISAVIQAPEDTIVVQDYIFVESPTISLLQNLAIETYTQAWGVPQLGKSVENNQISLLGGSSFRFGIGTHANSSIVYKTAKKYRYFSAIIGLDDESSCGDGAYWILKGDNKEIYRSPRLTAQMVDTININISDVNKLVLETYEGENNFCDHSNWANAWLH